jgi:divalent metal cation (Fe/Co/Zn/Cd) transporter
MLTWITIPTASSTDLFASVGVFVGDLWPLLAVAMGVPLAFYIIKQVIALVPKGRSRTS